MRKICVNRCAKIGGPALCRILFIRENPEGVYKQPQARHGFMSSSHARDINPCSHATVNHLQGRYSDSVTFQLWNELARIKGEEKPGAGMVLRARCSARLKEILQRVQEMVGCAPGKEKKLIFPLPAE